MSNKFIYLPSEFSAYTSSDIGTFAKEYSNLESFGIITPKMIVVPQNTLKIIAQANNLQAKIYKLIQETNFSSRLSKNNTKRYIKQLIYSQRIPEKLAEKLLETYHNYFQQSFILVQNSELLSTNNVITDNIHSDANFIDAILETWALLSVNQYQKLLSRTHTTHEILFPSPLLIIEQVEAQTSGSAHTFDTRSGNKNQISIKSSFGIFNDSNNFYDEFWVDVRTFNIVSKQINTKENKLRRVIGKLTKDSVLANKKNTQSLTNAQIEEITQITSKIKKKYLSQLKINWAIVHDKIYIEKISPVEIEISKQPEQIINTKLLYTIVIPGNNINNNSDGHAIFSSGQLLSIAATHPMQTAKTKQKTYLIQAVSKVLTKLCKKSDKPIIYRANNFTSKQFSKLSFSSLYEAEETNPDLGFRGGIRFIAQQEAFKIELDILTNTLKDNSNKIHLLLPFIRSPEELSQVYQIIKNSGLTNLNNFSMLLELSTPENILNLESYPLQLINGVVFNTQNIHSLLLGIDHTNMDIYLRYSQNTSLLKQLVETAIKHFYNKRNMISLLQKPEFFVDLRAFNQELFEELCTLNISGFIVNQSVTDIAKKCMIDKEYNSIL